eukprot:scaffold73741_cov56-Phaeocystis_antarctica.AAC.1
MADERGVAHPAPPCWQHHFLHGKLGTPPLFNRRTRCAREEDLVPTRIREAFQATHPLRAGVRGENQTFVAGEDLVVNLPRGRLQDA